MLLPINSFPQSKIESHLVDSTKESTNLEFLVLLKSFIKELVRLYPQINVNNSDPINGIRNSLALMAQRRETNKTRSNLDTKDLLLLKSASLPNRNGNPNLNLNYTLVGSIGTSLWALADSYQIVQNNEQNDSPIKQISDQQREFFTKFLRKVKDIDITPFALYSISEGSLQKIIYIKPGLSAERLIAIDLRTQDLRDDHNKNTYVSLKIDGNDVYTIEPKYMFAYKLIYSVVQFQNGIEDGSKKNLQDLETLLIATLGIHSTNELSNAVKEIFNNGQLRGIQMTQLEKEMNFNFHREDLNQYFLIFLDKMQANSELRKWLLNNIKF